MKLLAPCAALLLAAPLHAQNVWTVAADGSGDFTDLQAAVDFAADGDVLNILAGSYGPIDIVGKGLTLQSSGFANITAFGFFFPEDNAIAVSGLSSDQTVYVRGLALDQLGYYAGYTVLLSDNQGAVVFEDCPITGSGRPFEARTSQSVTLANCQVTAPISHVEVVSGIFLGSLSYNGVGSLNSNLYLYDCQVSGGNGLGAGQQIFGPTTDAVEAGNGINVNASTLFAHGCTFVGGFGPNNSEAVCGDGPDGGSGVVVSASSQVTLLDCQTVAGTGGLGSCGGLSGVDGLTIDDAPGSSLIELSGNARRGSLQAVALEGGTFSATLSGVAGDQVFAAFSAGVESPLELPGGELFVHLAGAFEILPVGVLPVNGLLELEFFAPPLAGAAGAQFATQFLFFDGTFHEGGPTQMLVVPSS